MLAKTPFGAVSIGVSGRNLLFYAPMLPGDPAVNTQGAGNIQGLELNGAPATRNYGFNIRIHTIKYLKYEKHKDFYYKTLLLLPVVFFIGVMAF